MHFLPEILNMKVTTFFPYIKHSMTYYSLKYLIPCKQTLELYSLYCIHAYHLEVVCVLFDAGWR